MGGDSYHPLRPPDVVFVVDDTLHNRILVSMFALPVGAVLALAWELQR